MLHFEECRALAPSLNFLGKTMSQVPTKIVSSALSGEAIERRLRELAEFTDVPGQMTRLSLSPSHRKAADMLLTWFKAAGMTAEIDAMGSVVGRYGSASNDAKTLIIGSHIDTVPNGGIYDGNLGVITGLALVEELSKQGKRLPFAIEVIAFSDEEGVRFPSALSSSRAIAGKLEAKALDEKDRDGISRREALIAFGCNPDDWQKCQRNPADLMGYLEVHIEQGPVLEAHLEPLGVVTGIAGTSRGTITITGKAGHAGTTPMSMRRDALTAAAEVILAIEKIARDSDGLVTTVGVVTIAGQAVNVIPGEVTISYDIRAGQDKVRVRGVAQAIGVAKEIAEARNCVAEIDMTYAAPAAESDPAFVSAFSSAIKKQTGQVIALPSGAGHDAMVFRNVCPQAMLFIRCKDGLSHHPEEHATVADIGAGAQALFDAVIELANSSTKG
jgi:allantoate deiminase